MKFYQIKSKVTETAKSAIKKSNEIVEVTKLNISIGDAQTRIDVLMKEVGQIIYDAYKDGDVFSDELTNRCEEIEQTIEKVSQIKEKIAEIKKMKLCPRCEKENEIDAAYCSKCGFRIEEDEIQDD
ncbi:zinc ribbon domain-containing protein [Petroclostridium sp. X23]|uniref:zinc ribbon domain-containing protein n=1 Tax=Petroclostridium sp. X23 TaxID=3045146 RepID=UPI0024ADAA26|nr:zinc ribbon domain-containing protein [Petroclostridium sp. X23]WHH59108.1 zinc ribbon domain-containing protein [Petroclostridium sp. X23]